MQVEGEESSQERCPYYMSWNISYYHQLSEMRIWSLFRNSPRQLLDKCDAGERLQRRRLSDNRLNICSVDWKYPILSREEVKVTRRHDVSSSRKRKVAPIWRERCPCGTTNEIKIRVSVAWHLLSERKLSLRRPIPSLFSNHARTINVPHLFNAKHFV